jgi:hypothetical protein
MLCGFVWIVYFALILINPLLSRNRFEAVVIFTISLIAVPDLTYKWMIGSFYAYSLDKYIFCAIGLLAACIRHRTPHRIKGRFHIPILLFLFLELANARDPDFGQTVRLVLPVIFTIAIPYYLVSSSLSSTEDLRRILLVLALGGFAMAIVATIETHLHWLIYKQVSTRLHIDLRFNPYQQMRGGALRATASFPESISLGDFISSAGIATWASARSFPSRARKYFVLLVILLGAVATGSRGAIIGLGMGTLMFDLCRRNWRAFFGKASLALGGYFGLLIAAPYSNFAKELLGKGADSQGSTDYRVLLLRRGMEEISRHPVLGTNAKAALRNLSDITQGQQIVDLVNTYIKYGLTLGYPAIFILLGVFLSLCWAMATARRRMRQESPLIDAASFVFAVSSYMGIVVAVMSFGGEEGIFFYEVAAIGSCVWALRKSQVTTPGGVVAVAPAGPPIRAMILADREAALAGRRRPRPAIAE